VDSWYTSELVHVLLLAVHCSLYQM